MKNINGFHLSYNMTAYSFAIFNFLLALCFFIAFFHITQDLPDMIPVHWSEHGGFDKIGNKTELYPIAISSMVIAAIALPSTIMLIKRIMQDFLTFLTGFLCFQPAYAS